VTTSSERQVTRLPPTWGPARWALGGLAVGLAWGVVARTWMRYISTDPEFSWSGTVAIVVLSGVSGATLALAEALRRAGRHWMRRLLALPALLLFVSPGALMFPAAFFGGLAISGRGGRWVRATATLVALAPVAVVAQTEQLPRSRPTSLAWFALLCLVLAVGWSAVFRRAPHDDPVTPPR
jgi:hypothetical protein